MATVRNDPGVLPSYSCPPPPFRRGDLPYHTYKEASSLFMSENVRYDESSALSSSSSCAYDTRRFNHSPLPNDNSAGVDFDIKVSENHYVKLRISKSDNVEMIAKSFCEKNGM